MKLIHNAIEPTRLLLSWQDKDSLERRRFIVAELVKDNEKILLHYLSDTQDYKDAFEHGFFGHPAFQIRKGKIDFQCNVLEAFMRRLPPRNRRDFSKYLLLRGLSSDIEISDFALLGYVGAKLPDDGFELIHPFDSNTRDFEFILEIAGFRYNSEISISDIDVGNSVSFEKEPNNKNDPMAVKISMEGRLLGYVDKGRLELIHRLMDDNHVLNAEVTRKNGTLDRPLVYVFVTVSSFDKNFISNAH